MYIFDIVNMNGLRSLIAEKRGDAIESAREQGAWIRSRGTFLSTASNFETCRPYVSQECNEWRGTKKEIEEAIALVVREYPDVTRIYIEGGYDCADTLEGLEFDYEPMASWWEEVVWTRE